MKHTPKKDQIHLVKQNVSKSITLGTAQLARFALSAAVWTENVQIRQVTSVVVKLIGRLRGPVLHALARGRASGVLVALLVASLVGSWFTQPTQAVINEQLNFQARVLNDQGAVVPDGFYNVRFNVYDGCSQDSGGGAWTNGEDCYVGTSSQWSESYDYNGGAPDQRVRVVNGYLSVQLNELTNDFSTVDWTSDELFLGIELGGTGTVAAWDGEMDPLIRFTSVPYAFNSNTLDGLDSTDFVQIGQGEQAVNTAGAVISIDQAGAGDVLQLQVANADVLTLSNAGNLTVSGNGTFNGGTISSGEASTTTGNITFYDSNSANFIRLQAGDMSAAGGNLTFTLPTADGNLNECLSTDGSGNLSFVACTAAITLQAAYDNGNTITTTDNRDIEFDLAENLVTPANESSFIVDIQGTNNTFEVQDGGVAVLSVVDGGQVTFGNNNIIGSVRFSDGTATPDYATITVDSSLAQATTYNLPVTTSATVDICTTDGNCAGASGNNLQQAYDASVGGTTPEIKLDTTRNGVDIQDADTTIAGSLLTVRQSNGSGLGAAIFDVQSTGQVGIGGGAGVNTLTVAGSTSITATASGSITGTADPDGTTALAGSGTFFDTELVVGDRITVNGETRTVTAIASATSLTVDTAFTDTAAAAVTRLPAQLVVNDSSSNVDFIIQDNGSIGIGTVSPDSFVEISQSGQTNTDGLFISEGTRILRLYNSAGSSNIGASGDFNIGTLTTNAANGEIAAGRVLNIKSFDNSGSGRIDFDFSGTDVARFTSDGNFNLLSEGTADGTTTEYNSQDLVLQGSRWNGVSADNQQISLRLISDGSGSGPNYRLAVLDNGGTEFAYFDGPDRELVIPGYFNGTDTVLGRNYLRIGSTVGGNQLPQFSQTGNDALSLGAVSGYSFEGLRIQANTDANSGSDTLEIRQFTGQTSNLLSVSDNSGNKFVSVDSNFNLNLLKEGTAGSGTPQNSQDLVLQGSAYDTDGATDVDRQVSLRVITQDTNDADYRLAVLDDSGTEFVSFDGFNNRVGINTTSPSEALQVNGNIKLGAIGNTIYGPDSGSLLLSSGDVNGVEDRITFRKDVNLTGGATQYEDILYIDENGIEFAPRNSTMYLTGPELRGLTIRTGDSNDTSNDEIGFDVDTDLNASSVSYSRVLTIDALNGGSVGIGETDPDAQLEIAGNRSQSAWGANGVQLQVTGATLTDTDSATGTVALAVANSFGSSIIDATNTVTYTDAATVYIQGAPTAGGDETITNSYALLVDSGDVRFDGDLAVNGGNITSTAGLSLDVADGNSITLTDGTNTLVTISDDGSVGSITVTGTATVSGASVTVGTASATDGSIILQNATNAFTVTIDAPNQTTGSGIVSLPDTAGANDTLCLVNLGNCAGSGGGATTSGGATNRITKYSSASELTASSLLDDGTVVTIDNDIDLNVDSNTLFVDGSADAVGIGTNLPAEKLTVFGGNILNTVDSTVLTDGGSLNSGDIIMQGYYDSDGTAGITATARQLSLRTVVDASGNVRLAVLNNAGTEFVAFDGTNGRLGVGLSDPSTLLQVDGVLTVGDAGNTNGSIRFERAGDSFRGTLQFAALDENTTITIPDPGSGVTTDTVCLLTLNNCAGSGNTLQQAYDTDINGGDAIIALTTADDSLIVRNPATSGTDSAFVLQVENLATGNTIDGFAGLDVNAGGSFDTTTGNLTNYGLDINANATESAGGNVLTNVGLNVNVSGGDTNYAALFNGGNVGINTTAPTANLEVRAGTNNDATFAVIDDGSGQGAEIYFDSSSVDAGDQTNIFVRRSRGSASSPSALSAGDSIGEIRFQGYDLGSYSDSAVIRVIADAAHADTTDTPGALIFGTTSDGNNNSSERLRIDSTGDIIVQPNARLLLNQEAVAGSGSPQNSQDLVFRGSAYDTDGATDVQRDVTLRVITQDSNDADYRLAVLDDSGTEFVSFDGFNQRVGIGTSTPASALTVDGAVRFMQAEGTNYGQFNIAENGTLNDDVQLTVSGTEGTSYFVFTDDGRLAINGSTNGSLPDALLDVNGTNTLSAWGTNGVQLQVNSGLFTDNSTAASGTAPTTVFNSFASPTLDATNATVTFTDVANVYIQGAPALDGLSDDTITNSYALWVDGGDVRFDDTLAVQGSSISVGTSSTTDGSIILNNATNAFSVTIDATAQTTGSATISLPDTAGANDTFCLLTLDNCGGSAPTLQAAYTNSTGGTTPEIKLDSTRTAVDIQDADTSVAGNLLVVRASNGAGLGTPLLSVESNGGTTLASLQPASQAGNGTDATDVFTVTGGAGGDTSGTTGEVAGTGSDITLTAGNGGTADAGSTNGNGGSITLQAGAAGAGTGTAGSAGNILLNPNGNGRVGIGDSTPTYELDVNGMIGISIGEANFATLSVEEGGDLDDDFLIQVDGASGNAWYVFSDEGRTGLNVTTNDLPDAALEINVTDFSQAAWGSAGTILQVGAGTVTDSSTAGSGTAPLATFNSFAAPTLAATNTTVTTTDAATVYIGGAPIAGTNQTITNAYALLVDGGNVRFDGNLNVRGTNLTLGEGSTTNGSVVLQNATNNSSVTINAPNQTTGSATISFPDTAGANDTFCLLSLNNCAGSGNNLQQAYDADADGGDATIQLSSADDSLIVSNPSSGGTDSTFVMRVEQLNVGTAQTALVVDNVGSGYSFRVNDSGTGDTTPLVVDDAGNLGVGTDTPGAKIEAEVADTANEIGLLVDQNDITNNPSALVVENAGSGNSLQVNTNDFRVDGSGNTLLGGNNNAGSLRIYDGDATSNYIELLAPTALAGNLSFNLPTAYGSTGACLKDTDGAGTLGFADCNAGSISGTGADGQVTFWNGTSSLSSSANFYWNNTTSRLALGGISDPSTLLQVTGAITVGDSSSVNGSIIFENAINANQITVNASTNTAGALTYQFDGAPSGGAGTYTICTTDGNCSGAGGGVTTLGGTTNYIPRFTGGQSIGNSMLYDDTNKIVLTNTQDAELWLDADTDNVSENDNPFIRFRQDGGTEYMRLGLNGATDAEFTGAIQDSAFFYLSNSAAFQFASSSTGQLLTLQNTGNLGVGTVAPETKLQVVGAITSGDANTQGRLVLYDNDAGGQKLTIQAGAFASDMTFTWPNTTGTTGDCIKTDGSGLLSFGACGTGVGSSYTQGSVIFANSSNSLTEDNANFYFNDANDFFGIGLGSTTAARLHVSDNITANNWGLNGIALRVDGATYTDDNTAASGTAATNVVSAFGQPTLAASNTSVTTTDAATLYVAGAPVAGTNMTISNSYSIWVGGGSVKIDSSTPLVVDSGDAEGDLISIVAPTAITGNQSYTLPATGGTFCTTGGNCAGVGGTGDVLLGGNSVGAGMVLGNNANSSLALETNGTDRLIISNTGSVELQHTTAGTEIFKILDTNSTTVTLFAVDSTNDRVVIGTGGTTSTSPVVLSLDAGDTTSGNSIANDPAGVNGAIYYNTDTDKFRCYESGGWRNCSDPDQVDVGFAPDYPNTVANVNFGTPFVLEGNVQTGTPGTAGYDEHNYYDVEGNNSSLSSNSFIMSYRLPDNFSTFITDSFKIYTHTLSTTYADSRIHAEMRDELGNVCIDMTTSLNNILPTATNTWQQQTLDNPGGSCSFTAGDIVIFEFDLQAKNNTNVRIGEFEFKFDT